MKQQIKFTVRTDWWVRTKCIDLPTWWGRADGESIDMYLEEQARDFMYELCEFSGEVVEVCENDDIKDDKGE